MTTITSTALTDRVEDIQVRITAGKVWIEVRDSRTHNSWMNIGLTPILARHVYLQLEGVIPDA